MSKYYEEKEIWNKLMEELSEFDIDNSLYYSINEDGFSFAEYITGFNEFDVERVDRIFQDKEYDIIDTLDLYSFNKIAGYIKNNNLYRDMIVARCNLNDYLFKNDDPDDDKVTQLSRKFEITAEIYLWCKYIFATVIKTMRNVINNCSSNINEIYEFI